ncbi:hypothetical protein LAZ67_5002693 [Cordylochernes scorpioides]|uniref:ATP-dependent DNA helicase n=1 Tax=Cordylochernes scorpioides TaxID=51811 RepID=A0ABY6KLE7_9ARAC|nr:hypothetical protein LAZ67_5002693 [Cordylochernes scorpioides]
MDSGEINEWHKAMEEELSEIEKHKVWTQVPRENGMKVINSKWVYSTKKTSNDGIYKRKARLVAVGCNQRYGVDYKESFSPVLKKESLRTIVALATQQNLIIKTYDVKTAYLYGELEETVYEVCSKGIATFVFFQKIAWILGDLNTSEDSAKYLSSGSAEALAELLNQADLADVATFFDAALEHTRFATIGSRVDAHRLDRILLPSGFYRKVERFFANKTRAFDHTALQLAKVETVSEIDKQEKETRETGRYLAACGTCLLIGRDVTVAIASSGIAATLFDGGRTAHSALKLPLNIQVIETPTCNISKYSGMGKVLRSCQLIIWDECTMAHKKSLEALNRTLKYLRGNEQLFGGALILLAGDFRQTLPVIPRSTPADELNACL